MASTITPFTGTAPSRQGQVEADFNSNTSSWLSWLLDTAIGEVNTLLAELESNAATIDAGASNFQGSWSTLTGAISIGETVYHAVASTSGLWICVSAIADVTTKTPGTHSEWVEIPCSSGYDLISTATLADDATVDFTLSGYSHYQLFLANVIPVNDNVDLNMRTSSDGGSTFDNTVGNYKYAGRGYDDGGSTSNAASGSDTEIRFTPWTVGSDTDESGVSGVIDIYAPSDAYECKINWTLGYIQANGQMTYVNGAGVRATNADVDAIRLFFDTGNLESGSMTLYGVI